MPDLEVDPAWSRALVRAAVTLAEGGGEGEVETWIAWLGFQLGATHGELKARYAASGVEEDDLDEDDLDDDDDFDDDDDDFDDDDPPDGGEPAALDPDGEELVAVGLRQG